MMTRHEWQAVWRTALVALVVLIPTAGFAQVLATNFRELRLKTGPGDTLFITDQSGREFSSTVTELSESLLAVRVGETTRRFTEADVTRIRQRQPDPLWTGALIGLGVGMGLAGVVVAFDESCSYEGGWSCAGPVLFEGAIGAGVGIGIDALIKGRKVIYEKAPARISLDPIVSPTARGLRLSARF